MISVLQLVFVVQVEFFKLLRKITGFETSIGKSVKN
jgi:hypothetical protein